MKKTEIIMGMPITIEVIDDITSKQFQKVFDYFKNIDEQFSTYKETSEISRINSGLPKKSWSKQMAEVLELCEQTKIATDGYFDIEHNGQLDPSGLVKGWAINNAAKMLKNMSKDNFYVEAGGDIAVSGLNADNQEWVIGLRNPFNIDEVIKIIKTTNRGIATSGTYIRGQHIYNPHREQQPIKSVKSLTVIGPDIYEADRYATAAFAMGEAGINFIEQTPNLEAYMVSNIKIATYTSGFEGFVPRNV